MNVRIYECRQYRWEAVRLRALLTDATTAAAKRHLEEQILLNEQLARGGSRPPVTSRYGAVGVGAQHRACYFIGVN
jgi:hypothetical protein